MVSMSGLNDVAGKSIPLLDISCLSEGQKIECLAYVQSCNVKISRIGTPFATFYLKDKNATVIAARLFDIGEEKDMVQIFARHPARVCAEVQVYNGSYSLVIDGDKGITVHNGDFDYESFIGKYAVDADALSLMYENAMGRKMSVEMYSALTVDFLGNGKVGAFLKIYDMALSNLLATADISGIDSKTLLEVFFTVMHKHYLILSRYNKFGPLERLMLHEEYGSIDCSDDCRYVITDTLRSICENTKPMHLYAHVIKEALMNASKTLQLVETNNTMVSGGTTQVYFTDMLGGNISGGVELLKY